MASPDIHRSTFGDDDPPSPSAVSRPIDIPSSYHNNNNWDVDFNQSGGLAYTPSYVGSFGSGRDSVWGDREGTAVYNGAGGAGDLFDDSKYEPESYQTHTSPYLMMDNQFGPNGDSLFAQDATNIHIAFGEVDQGAPQGYSPRAEPFTAASPGSSIGIPDSGGNDQGQRSRASSMSSNHGAVQSSPYMHSGQPLYDHFTKLSFDQSALDASPSWGNQTLPSLNHPLSSSPAMQHASPPGGTDKPMSPPSLMIPADALAPPPNPVAGAPQGLGPEPQPAINLVPATPVSGGGAAGGAQLPFQQMLANLNRQRAFARGNAASTETALPSVASFQTSIESNLGDGSAAHSGSDAMTWTSIISASGQSQGTASTASLPQSRVYHHGYNVPVLPALNPSQQRSHPAMQVSELPNLPHTQSDPTVPSTQLPSFAPSSLNNNLMNLGQDSLLSAQLFSRSRSKSDTSSRPPVWFNSIEAASPAISDDLNTHVASSSVSSFGGFSMSPSMPPKPTFDFSQDLDINFNIGDVSGIRRANSDGSRHKRGVKSEDLSSLRGAKLVPTSNTDFIRSVTAADGSLAPVDPRSGAGPLRRRGSGSAGHERNASLSSLRSTPYQRPSPHTSPGPSPHHSPGTATKPLPDAGQYMRVERPLVTTPATKTASANRRRAEATFVCPVPGCGSTFTRHFNLRGHLRSHNEERPFKCKWPGCEKGFARQHDCKRHEALHLNIRPYTCEGCQKTFARMDALNRHLRSEGGVDCQKVHQPTDEPPVNGVAKVEDWTQSGAVLM